MPFSVHQPCPALLPYVRHIAVSVSLESERYQVLADTGLVLGFQFRGKISKLKNGKQEDLNWSGITGLHHSLHHFSAAAETGSVLVYFREAGASSFFPALHELFSESVSLDNFFLRSELLVLEEQLSEARTDRSRIKLIESFLLSRLQSKTPPSIVQAALELLIRSRGQIRIKLLAQSLNTSISPLEKKFRAAVGCSPKKFASILRFRQSLDHQNDSNSLTDLAHQSGYFDQSHFIKEFRSFTGQNPESFFLKK